MSTRRWLGFMFGILALLSVVSVLMPVRFSTRPMPCPTAPPAAARVDTVRLDRLQRDVRAQQDEVTALTTETRRLSVLLRPRETPGSQPSHPMAATTNQVLAHP